jgi:hypothetical protein
MAVLLAIGIAAGAGDLSHPAPRTLPGGALASQIALGVQAQRGLKAPPAVDCPSAEPVRAGWSFRCTVAIGATRQTLDVTEIDSRGTLRWSPATGP